jgi:hypothetical protein
MKIMLKNVRLSFPALFKAEAFKPGDEPRFKATLLIPEGSAQAKQVEAAAIAALEEKFPKKGATIYKQVFGNNNKCNISDGNLAEYDGYAGMIAVSAKSKTRPLVIDADKTPLAESDGKPYAGCYVNAQIEFFGYDNSGKGVSATLKGVQFVRDGDAFSGSAPASDDDFDDLSSGADEDDELV